MSDIHTKKAAEIVKKIIYITLATASKDNQPWNSPVYSAYDRDLNFYWTSYKDGVHSQNVRSNNKVFVVIYNADVPESSIITGVYIQGKAYELSDKDEITFARETTQSRKGKKATKDEYKKFIGDNVRRVYKMVPSKIWVNDVVTDKGGNYVKDIRVEVAIEELKKML